MVIMGAQSVRKLIRWRSSVNVHPLTSSGIVPYYIRIYVKAQSLRFIWGVLKSYGPSKFMLTCKSEPTIASGP